MARGGLVGRFPALGHRNFRRYAVGQMISLAGFWMQSVAQGWLVFRLSSNSELALGTVAFIGYLPVFLFSPLAGVVADRREKWRLILVTQSLAMLLAFVQGAIVVTDVATVPIVAGMAFLVGLVGAFDLPIRQAFIMELVSPDDLPAAIAFNASVFNTARVVGPAVAGAVVATAGEGPCFFLNGLSYVAALWAIGGMTFQGARAVGRRGPGSIRSGLAYVRRRPVLGALLVTLGAVSTLALQTNVLMPSLAVKVFGRSAQGYGTLLTAYGLGAVVTALRLASRQYSAEQHRRNLLLGLSGMAAGLFVVAGSARYEVALAGQLLAGFGMLRYTATTNALVQLNVDQHYRGRVMGLHTVMFAGAAPFGALILGALGEQVGPRAALVVSGAGAVLAAMWLALRLPADPFEDAARP